LQIKRIKHAEKNYGEKEHSKTNYESCWQSPSKTGGWEKERMQLCGKIQIIKPFGW
jgi:hypothetical protein